jgi:predicted GIY-YIG superfamily endonuclease
VTQLLLFPDPRPLVERLGLDFFRRAPQCAGVYLMRDSADVVLYVGKAKNLRKRLGSYRVANPDRLRKRHLKLLRDVARIQLEECINERTALAREAELLLALRPRFNRAGTWLGPPQFIAWKVTEAGLEFALSPESLMGWQAHGPLKSGAVSLRVSIVRLAWCAIHQAGYSHMPRGWWHRIPGVPVIVHRREATLELLEEASARLAAACQGQMKEFSDWIRERTVHLNHPFEIAARDLDLERLQSLQRSESTQNHLHRTFELLSSTS